MAAILTDIQIMESGTVYHYQYKKLADTLWLRNYEGIFKKHGINREVFLKAYKYYQTRPEEFSKVWEMVFNQLQSKEAELQRKP